MGTCVGEAICTLVAVRVGLDLLVQLLLLLHELLLLLLDKLELALNAELLLHKRGQLGW